MIEPGNLFAALALLGWPLVVAALFRALAPERALIWSLLGAYMFLPQLTQLNLPGVPPLTKETLPNLAALIACVIAFGRFPGVLPAFWTVRAALLLVIVAPALTVLNNLEPVRFGVDRFGDLMVFDPNALARPQLPGLRAYDSASVLAGQVLAMLPFFLGRAFLASAGAIREILVALVIAALIYALPMLYEVRFSPQLHTMLYGFFQHDFAQTVRGSGFRPFVFMPHGLWVAFFAFMCAMAAVALTRAAGPQRRPWMLALCGLTVALVVLCRSLGPMVFALVFLPLVALLRPRLQLALAALIAVGVLAYPLLRGAELIPTRAIVAQVAAFEPERAQSLEYRFDNEDRVLAHVRAKPLLGWGGWGRFMPHDPATGSTSIVVDGMWIITIGQFGWLGYLGQFGLLALPLILLWWHARGAGAGPVPVTVSALALILAANLIDLLPNATLIPFTWLIAGAVLGHAEALAREDAARRRTAPAVTRTVLGHAAPPPDHGRPADRPRTLL